MNYSSDGLIFRSLNIASSFNYSNIKDKFNALVKPNNTSSLTSTLLLMSIDSNLNTKTDNNSEISTGDLLVINNQTSDTSTTRVLTDIKIYKNDLYLYTSTSDALVVNIDPITSSLTFLDNNKKPIEITKTSSDNTNIITFSDSRFNTIKISLSNSILVTSPYAIFSVTYSKDGFKILTPTGNVTDIIEAESFGFKGKEKWGSSRGYIWSRSIPMIKDTIILGHGPDTYEIYFPKNDYVAKMKFMQNIFTIVDKPHSLYLQLAINTGILSLLAFLIFNGWYIIYSIKLYIKGYFNQFFAAGVACLAAVTSFLVSSLVNDSTISVSIIFWIILGVGIASNNLYSNSIKLNDSNIKGDLKK